MIKFILQRVFLFFLAGIGGLWTVTEITVFVKPEWGNALKEVYWIFIGIIALISLLLQLKILTIKYRIHNSDVEIEIRWGDLLKSSGNKVVGFNTNFDTKVSNTHVHPNSLHGKFIIANYNNSIHKLDSEITHALTSVTPKNINQPSPGGKQVRYDIGQVAQLDIDGNFYYLLAYSNFSQQWKAESTVDDIKDSIAKLWVHVFDNPSNMKTINVPVFGTSFARLNVSRADIIKEIIKSFLANHRSNKKITEKLCIVVHRKDYKHLIADWLDLRDFVRYETQNKI